MKKPVKKIEEPKLVISQIAHFALYDNSKKQLISSSISETKEELADKINTNGINYTGETYRQDDIVFDLVEGTLKVVELELNYNIKENI